MLMEKKQTRKKKLLAAIALIAILSISGILAYMTDHETANNLFTVGKVDFNLYESAWDGELPDGTYLATDSNALGISQAEDIYAGKTIPKNPAIKNNSKNDAYLRIRVRIPAAVSATADASGRPVNGGIPTETELFTYRENPGTGMRRVSQLPQVEVYTDSNAQQIYHIYEYQYTGGGSREIPLPAGQDIPALFDEVVFANIIGDQLDGAVECIQVDFRAIQSGGFESPEAAWSAYERQNPQLE